MKRWFFCGNPKEDHQEGDEENEQNRVPATIFKDTDGWVVISYLEVVTSVFYRVELPRIVVIAVVAERTQ